MEPKVVNRFSFFAEKDTVEGISRPSQEDPTNEQKLAIHSTVFNENPWHEVKPRDKVTRKATHGGILSEKTTSNRTIGRRTTMRGGRNVPHETRLSTSPLSPTDPREYFCGVCNLKLGSKSALQSHIKQSPRDHQYYCNLCVRIFKDRNGLQNHVDHAFGHEVSCNLCLSAFKDEWGLRNHFENNLYVGHGYACLTCLEGFTSRQEMDHHLKTAKKHVWCATCFMRFKNQDERDDHWKTTSKHKHCLQPGCDFDSRDVEGLEKHLALDHFQCEGCHAILQSQTKLNAHVDTCSHALRCSGCRIPHANKESLVSHQSICYASLDNGSEAKPELSAPSISSLLDSPVLAKAVSHKCWFCPTVLSSYTHLVKHLETGKCPSLPNAPELLVRTLGKWWYSPLYMDLDIHAQIRQGRLDMHEVMNWIKEGALMPYLCRAEGCDQIFGRFSSLVFHLEGQACEWTVERLRLDWLEKELIGEIKGSHQE